jgi:hypothetical protein
MRVLMLAPGTLGDVAATRRRRRRRRRRQLAREDSAAGILSELEDKSKAP